MREAIPRQQRRENVLAYTLMVAIGILGVIAARFGYRHAAFSNINQEADSLSRQKSRLVAISEEVPERDYREQYCQEAPRALYNYHYDTTTNELYYRSLCIPKPTLFTACNPDDIKQENKALFQDEINLNYNDYRCSIVHVNIANHFYQAALNIIKLFPERRDMLLNDIDINKRTVLHLAMEVGAPGPIISELLSSKNVMMADKDGITPLMLAARGAETSVTEEILKTIGKDRVHQAIHAKDNNGRTVADWSKLSKEEITARFRAVEVDGSKDDSHCTNALFVQSKYTFLSTTNADKQRTAAVYADLGLEAGENYIKKMQYVGLKATRENVRKLRRFATESSPEAKNARKELSNLWSLAKNSHSGLWQYIDEKLAAMEPGLSGHSLTVAYSNRQQDNAQLIKTYEKSSSQYFQNLILQQTVRHQFRTER